MTVPPPRKRTTPPPSSGRFRDLSNGAGGGRTDAVFFVPVFLRRPGAASGSDSMLRTMLQAKLHRARVTCADLDYEGSCGIDQALLELSGLRANQYIEIYK